VIIDYLIFFVLEVCCLTRTFAYVLTSGSCSCHKTNLVTGVSQQPVLDCGTIFHPDCGGRDFPSISLDDL